MYAMRTSLLLALFLVLTVAADAADAPTAKVLHSLSDTPTVVEDVVFDAKTNIYLLSSIDQRKIIAVRNGETREFLDPQAGSLLGIALAPQQRALFACSTVSKLGKEYMRPNENEHSEVLEIDLDRATVRRTIGFPEPSKPHFCDSVVATARGDVYVTDSGANSICWIFAGSRTMTRCVAALGRLYPQGVVPANGSKLLVASYAVGIVELDFATEAWRQVHAPDGAKLAGIDGLTGYKNCLIGVQNGAKPARVLVMHLNAAKDTITRVDEVNLGNTELDEPTWGNVAGEQFVFVGNSQNETYRTKGAAAMKPTLLMQFPLPADCGAAPSARR